jgi:Glycosyl transferases group 1
VKVTVLTHGRHNPQVGWIAIDEWAELLAHYFAAEVVSPVPIAHGAWVPAAWQRRHRFHPQPTDGGDVLIVVARQPDGLAMVRGLQDARRKFNKIYGWVADSYFHAGYPAEAALYDGITVTANEDIAYPTQKYGVTVKRQYQGADCLRWAAPALPSPHSPRARDVDVIGFGRMPPSYHGALQRRLHPAGSPHLYLHSPLGNASGPSIELERGMLFKLLHRTRVSLAFHLFVEPSHNRPRSMMVTSRWLESLMAGCIVAGKRPVSTMADDMLCWPGATVELADDAEQACDEVLALLHDNDRLAAQRVANVQAMLRQHDWRWRLRELCQLFNLPEPAGLAGELEKVEATAAAVRAV